MTMVSAIVSPFAQSGLLPNRGILECSTYFLAEPRYFSGF